MAPRPTLLHSLLDYTAPVAPTLHSYTTVLPAGLLVLPPHTPYCLPNTPHCFLNTPHCFHSTPPHQASLSSVCDIQAAFPGPLHQHSTLVWPPAHQHTSTPAHLVHLSTWCTRGVCSAWGNFLGHKHAQAQAATGGLPAKVRDLHKSLQEINLQSKVQVNVSSYPIILSPVYKPSSNMLRKKPQFIAQVTTDP